MDTFENLLHSLKYKTITVYVTSFSDRGLKYQGTLFQVNNNYISLILKVGNYNHTLRTTQKSNRYFQGWNKKTLISKSNYPTPQEKLFINFNKQFNPSGVIFKPGSIVEIPISKIEAIIHYPI